MIPRDKTAPVRDIKNPIDKKVPLTKPVTITLKRFIKIASRIPISYKTNKITIFAKPSFTPGIPMDGINDSAMLKTIAREVKMPIIAIFLTFIAIQSPHH